MCIHPFKNWELNESLEVLNDFTGDFTKIEAIENTEEIKTEDNEDSKEYRNIFLEIGIVNRQNS